ncbi:MAG: PHP domain-containing protein, partial [Victivallales bacterium]|nr:PHP domain-containing protein [Victivallales bacterium]
MLTKNIDFHIHSNVSDGSFSPTEIVRAALARDLGAVALTDHDSVSGIDEFLAAAAGTGLTAVPGVEISSLLSGREIHILGFFLDPHHPELLEFLARIRTGRNERNAEIIRRLHSLGYELTLEEVTAAAGGESVGRLHMATLLIQKGYFQDVKQAFERCLKRGAPAFCPRKLPHPEAA